MKKEKVSTSTYYFTRCFFCNGIIFLIIGLTPYALPFFTILGFLMTVLGIIGIIYHYKKHSYPNYEKETKKKEKELEKRICPLCLTVLEKDIKFCPNCGKRI